MPALSELPRIVTNVRLGDPTTDSRHLGVYSISRMIPARGYVPYFFLSAILFCQVLAGLKAGIT